MDQSTRQQLITAFNTVLRTSTLVGKIDQQRTSLAFAAFLQNLPDDADTVPLGPLYGLLLEQKAPEPAVRETLLVLHSRFARLNVRAELPPQLQSLSEEERAKIVLMASARGAVPAPGPRSAPPAGEAAPTDNEAAPAFVPEKKKKKAGDRSPRGLAAVLVLALLGLGGSLAYNEATKLPPPQSLTLNNANGLPCVELLDVPTAFLCYVHDDFLATPVETLKARAEVTRNDAIAKGLATRPVRVLSFEQRDLKYVF